MRKSLFIALPALLIVSSAFAVASGELPNDAPVGVLAPPAAEAAATPGCPGCAGHDCAQCPLALAAAQGRAARETAAPPASIHCTVD